MRPVTPLTRSADLFVRELKELINDKAQDGEQTIRISRLVRMISKYDTLTDRDFAKDAARHVRLLYRAIGADWQQVGQDEHCWVLVAPWGDEYRLPIEQGHKSYDRHCDAVQARLDSMAVYAHAKVFA